MKGLEVLSVLLTVACVVCFDAAFTKSCGKDITTIDHLKSALSRKKVSCSQHVVEFIRKHAEITKLEDFTYKAFSKSCHQLHANLTDSDLTRPRPTKLYLPGALLPCAAAEKIFIGVRLEHSLPKVPGIVFKRTYDNTTDIIKEIVKQTSINIRQNREFATKMLAQLRKKRSIPIHVYNSTYHQLIDQLELTELRLKHLYKNWLHGDSNDLRSAEWRLPQTLNDNEVQLHYFPLAALFRMLVQIEQIREINFNDNVIIKLSSNSCRSMMAF